MHSLPDGYNLINLDESFLFALWQKLPHDRILMDNYDTFRANFLRAMVIVGPDLVSRYSFPLSSDRTYCNVHCYWLSKRVFKELNNMRKVLNWVKDQFQLLWIFTTIPKDYVSLRRLVEKIGFSYDDVIPGQYSTGGTLLDGVRYQY